MKELEVSAWNKNAYFYYWYGNFSFLFYLSSSSSGFEWKCQMMNSFNEFAHVFNDFIKFFFTSNISIPTNCLWRYIVQRAWNYPAKESTDLDERSQKNRIFQWCSQTKPTGALLVSFSAAHPLKKSARETKGSWPKSKVCCVLIKTPQSIHLFPEEVAGGGRRRPDSNRWRN